MPLRPSWICLSIALAGVAARGQSVDSPANSGDSPKAQLSQPLHPGGGFKTDVNIPGSLQPLIDALHSPQFRIRDQATTVLLHLIPRRLSELCDALAHETDPEAATRMTQVAAHLFLKSMTPLEGHASLLGIKLNLELVHPDLQKPDALRMSVMVAELQPGYPAAQDLEVGDRLLAMDGKNFPIDMAIDDFRSNVTARPPGSIVQFTLIRDGQQMEVGVQLAGLPETAGALPGTLNLTNIESAIDQRNDALAHFLEGLKTSVKEDPLVVADNSPRNVAHTGDVTWDEGDIVVIQGGGAIRVVPAPVPGP